MQRTVNTPPVTKKQKEILYHLLKFRFLNTHQIQTILKHKNSTRILKMLKDLIEKDCVRRHYSRTSFVNNTKPAIYFLGPKARHILLKVVSLDIADLEYIYKENKRDEKFINHCLFLANTYLFLLKNKTDDEEIKFFTKFELGKYEYFPDPLPDAFVAVSGKGTTKRYFIDIFDDYTPSFVPRRRVKMYIEYVEQGDWDENTNYTKFPYILLIMPTESMKRHINLYGKALLEKTYEEKLSIFLTTKTMIEHSETDNNIWERI